MSIMRDTIGAFIGWLAASFDFLDAHDGAITAIATAFIALFTFTLYRSTDKLWQDAKETGERQASEMMESLRIANMSAEVAARSFNLSREDHIATHRPHIRVRKIATEGKPNGIVEVQYIIVNSGAGLGRIIETGTRL